MKPTERAAPSRFLAALLSALLLASCGGGGGSSDIAAAAAKANASQVAAAGSAPSISSGAATMAATAPAVGTDVVEIARKLSAGSSDQAKAVDAALTSQFLSARPERIRQVVVFGDSLSDVGTYRVGDIAKVGGGKFTTNPGPVWPETVGALLGTQVTPFRMGFGGQSQVVGGTGFAMGGARVTVPQGIGCVANSAGDCTAALTIPVTQQITDYLDANGGKFTPNQMVFVFAGANDVLVQLAAFSAKLENEVPLAQAQTELQRAVALAAGQLAEQVVTRIIGNGATRVAVLTIPDTADTVFGNAPAQEQVRPLISAMVQLFNATLTAGIAHTGAKVIDIYAEFKRIVENPGKYHVSELNISACDATKIAMLTGDKSGTSLLCSPLTLVHPSAPFHYFFADGVHPTTLGHLIVAGFVLTEMWRLRLL